MHLTCRYEECTEIIAAYARALVKYDLLSVTDGTVKRSDGARPYISSSLATQIRTIGHFMKNCPTAILSQYGVWRINGTVVPLYDTLGPEALA